LHWMRSRSPPQPLLQPPSTRAGTRTGSGRSSLHPQCTGTWRYSRDRGSAGMRTEPTGREDLAMAQRFRNWQRRHLLTIMTMMMIGDQNAIYKRQDRRAYRGNKTGRPANCWQQQRLHMESRTSPWPGQAIHWYKTDSLSDLEQDGG
jgi:hypothetical protein